MMGVMSEHNEFEAERVHGDLPEVGSPSSDGL